MVPDSSLTHLWPTPVGGNVSLFYDLPSVTGEENLDSLWGTLEIFTRAAQAHWLFINTLAAPAAAGSSFVPSTAVEAFLADNATTSPRNVLEGLSARLNLGGAASAGVFTDALLAFDPALLVLEAFLAFFVGAPLVSSLSKRATQGSGAYQDFVAACKNSGLSLTEIGVAVTLAAGLLLFDIFISLSEDDPTDTLGYGVLILVIATFALWGLSVDVQAYYTLCCVGSGDLTTRVVLTDMLNNFLCVLRIFFCWVRYLFYDFQVEAVDLAFHYTDVANDLSPLTLLEGGAWFAPEPSEGGARPIWAVTSTLWVIIAPMMDVATTLLQLLLGLFKFAIALFLLWLLVDLFVLRPLALSETTGLLKRKN
jgi:Ca2+/Na+ antiporter